MTQIIYGDSVRVVNFYGNQKNGYLGTTPQSTRYGAIDKVGAFSSKIDHPSATLWKIQPAPGSSRKVTQNVTSGDQVSLIASDGSYLAVYNSGADPGVAGYPAVTGPNPANDGITIAWYVFVNAANPNNGVTVTDSEQVYFMAAFSPLAAVLDTNGAGGNNPFQYLVTGARVLNRDGGSGLWYIEKAS